MSGSDEGNANRDIRVDKIDLAAIIDPKSLKDYDQKIAQTLVEFICNDAADSRKFSMRELEYKARFYERAQYLTFFTYVVCISASTVMICLGHEVSGGGLLSVGTFGAIGSIFFNRPLNSDNESPRPSLRTGSGRNAAAKLET